MQHVRYIEDTSGDLLDVLFFCSRGCWLDSFAPDRIGEDATIGGASPCAASEIASEHCVHCGECGVLIDGPDGGETVVNLIERPPIDPVTGQAQVRYPRRTVELPYSEVCMHMRIAGRTADVELLPNGMAQVYIEGRPFSAPITRGEAGVIG